MKPFHDLLDLQMTRPGREREAYRLFLLPLTKGPRSSRAPATTLIPLTLRYVQRLREWMKRAAQMRKSDVLDQLEDGQGLELQHLELKDNRPWLLPEMEPAALVGECSPPVIEALETAGRGEIAELPEGFVYPELPWARPRTVTSVQVRSDCIRWQVAARDGEAWWKSTWISAHRLERWQKMLRVLNAPPGVRLLTLQSLVEEFPHAAVTLLEEEVHRQNTSGAVPSLLSELSEEMVRPLLQAEDKTLRTRARRAVDELLACAV